MSTKASILYDDKRGIHIYEELLDGNIYIQICRNEMCIQICLMSVKDWIALGMPMNPKPIAEIEEKIEILKDKLKKIKDWCEAYPIEQFPEPDLEAVKKVLEEAGLSFGAVTASNVRHVLEGIKRIIETD